MSAKTYDGNFLLSFFLLLSRALCLSRHVEQRTGSFGHDAWFSFGFGQRLESLTLPFCVLMRHWIRKTQVYKSIITKGTNKIFSCFFVMFCLCRLKFQFSRKQKSLLLSLSPELQILHSVTTKWISITVLVSEKKTQFSCLKTVQRIQGTCFQKIHTEKCKRSAPCGNSKHTIQLWWLMKMQTRALVSVRATV